MVLGFAMIKFSRCSKIPHIHRFLSTFEHLPVNILLLIISRCSMMSTLKRKMFKMLKDAQRCSSKSILSTLSTLKDFTLRLKGKHPFGLSILSGSKDARLLWQQRNIRRAKGENVAILSPRLNTEKAMLLKLNEILNEKN
jgi:hypothetical protein